MTPFWLTYVVRSFLRSGRRALFAVLCVAVGTAGVVALQTAGLTVENALTSNIRASNGGDISLASDQTPLSRSDLQFFTRLQRAGKISAWTAVSSVHATAVGTGGRLVPLSVDLVSVPPYPLGGQPTFVSPSNGNVGSLLAGPGDVLVTTVLAQELGVGVGSRVSVHGIGGSGLQATVRGILSETSFEHSAAMTVSTRALSTLTSTPPRYTAVYLNVTGAPDVAARSLRAQFPTATVQTVAEALQTAHQEVHDFQQFLLIVGLLALLIAGIGIFNAMQSILARRRLEIAMLKAMGFREWTLYLLFGGEAVLLGIIGGIAGTLLGVLGSKFITDALAHSQGIQVVYIVDLRTILMGIGLGIGATLIFAVMPIVRAAALRPLEILREGSPTTAIEWTRTVLLIALIFVLFTVLAWAALGDVVLAAEFVAGSAVACALLAGLFALAVSWMSRLGPPASRLSGALVFVFLLLLVVAAVVKAPALAAILVLGAGLFGLSIVLSRRQMLPLLIGVRSLDRRRARTSLMLVAFGAGILAMTVSLTIAIGLQGQITSALSLDRAANIVVITSGNRGNTVLRAARSLGGIHGHAVMTTATTIPVRADGRSLASILGPSRPTTHSEDQDRRIRALSGVTGYALAQGAGPANVQVIAGRPLRPSDAGTNHVLVSDTLMNSPFSLRPGSSITLRETGSGIVKPVQVIGFYHRQRRSRTFSGFFTPPVYADRALALGLGGGDAQTLVTFSADQSALARDATELQRLLPGALVIDIGDLTAIVDTILDELLHLLAVITAIVLGAGVAVVANGVAMAMLERRREIALFKAIGFGPGSVGGFVLVENALVGTLAGAASVLLTAIALAVISRLALQQAIGFDPTLAVVVLLIATAVAVVTAYLSARAPIAVRPLEALRNE